MEPCGLYLNALDFKAEVACNRTADVWIEMSDVMGRKIERVLLTLEPDMLIVGYAEHQDASRREAFKGGMNEGAWVWYMLQDLECIHSVKQGSICREFLDGRPTNGETCHLVCYRILIQLDSRCIANVAF